ncbi:alanine--tRNA ligase [Robertkochia marina]|uniref:Alanine--tRNA ligase n=1 Tax=Robertkochia marina TaxID=1227945 RepID=A0A4S3M492_9FLAO|nr:alanine--tRNA ligase [Robertkochia marina]THD69986.1 alanine--tRNA ligase [Robertkochia marina]TRZ43841.1 alanine--tRNA ligase [Robertkochia marina]
MTSKEIRQEFLKFFETRKHQVVPSAPMVIKDDPTLMFTNAGMNQFKEFFLGNKTPKYSRVTDTQKCLRVSGKHNDLEEVGKDTYHHTMFEMLGNWSFGDYFKKEAIEWAWELLTEVYKINKDQLYVTVFEGEASDGLKMDQEAYDLWKQIVPEDRILMGNKNDNFWEMGEQGPCGPCSEIHVDIRSEEERQKVSGASLVNMDHPQVVEIWNLVFMEFNRKADGSLEKLPAQHVDTGMGFERLCMVLQGVQSNYDTDVFMPLIKQLEAGSGVKYGASEETDIAIRVISDHVRAVAFAIADGQLPSNTGAGYVIRRILRRAIRYGFTFLDKKEPFIYELVALLSDQMKEFFPEIGAQSQLVAKVIREEEAGFLRTLEQGLQLLDQIIANNEGDTVKGVKAFELYDTYGFPIDLTALILSERNMKLDEKGFHEELKKQKERSRAATKVETGDWTILDAEAGEEFLGYDTLQTPSRITRYRKVERKKGGTIYQMVLDRTPFYAEGGGQVGDQGYLEDVAGNKIPVSDTKRENNLIIHFSKSLPKDPAGELTAVVSRKKRLMTQANHTATHLLHQALRQVLGTHVEQKGSMVNSDGLRFDFSHFSKMTKEELAEVEKFVNDRISEKLPKVEKRAVGFQEAVDDGAIALFGEKYGDKVRTINFGESTELCGGTHVENTADIWYFIITSESAVAAGVRRIEAITGEKAMEYLNKRDTTLEEVTQVLKNPADPVKAVSNLQEENAALKKQVEVLLKEKAGNLKHDLKGKITNVNGINFLAEKVDLNQGGIKDLCFELGGEMDDLFLFFATEDNGKAMLSCYISKDLAAARGLNAGQIVRELGKYIQGGGGGQPFFATAGGKNPDGIPEALENVKTYIQA